MQRYIEQLIEDLRSAALKSPIQELIEDNDPLNKSDEFENHLEEIERYINEEGEPLSSTLGISKNAFPSADILSESELELLVTEINKLLNAYNFIIEFPTSLPFKVRYQSIINKWDDNYVLIIYGQSHIEFCDFDMENCPYPDYCNSCHEHLLEMDEENIHVEKPSSYTNLLPTQEELHNFEREERKKNIKKVITEMTKEDYIKDVFEYCDRWCERCSVTSKCQLFKQEELLFPDGDDNDLEDDTFWEILEDIQEVSSTMLEEKAKNEGINLAKLLDEDDDIFIDRSRLSKEQKQLLDQSATYAKNTTKWYIDHSEFFKDNSSKWELKNDTNTIIENTQIIQWYSSIIPTRIERSIMCQQMDTIEIMEKNEINGCAKLAIVSIEISIQSWVNILNLMNECEDLILDQLNQLSSLLKLTETQFPDARNFIRPGID